MNMKEAKRFCDDLRLVGIEATCRAWGKGQNWTCIRIGAADFLWNPDGEYDGWEMDVASMTDEQIAGLLDEAHQRGVFRNKERDR